MKTLKSTAEMKMRHKLLTAQKAYVKVKVANSNIPKNPFSTNIEV